MAVLLNNNFDGGTTGSVITTANSGFNGDAFSYVNQLNGGVLQYASVGGLNLNRPTAEYVMLMSSGATANPQAYVGYNASTLGTLSTYWTRFYVYFSSLAINNTTDTCLFSSYLTSGFPGVSVFMATDTPNAYKLYIWNGFSSTFAQMTTNINAGEWNRVEFRATLSSSVGTADLYLYAGANSDRDTATEHVTQTAKNYGTSTINTATIGMDYGVQTNTPAVYFSNWQFNTTGYPGPAPFRAGLGFPSGNLTNPIAIHSDAS